MTMLDRRKPTVSLSRSKHTAEQIINRLRQDCREPFVSGDARR